MLEAVLSRVDENLPGSIDRLFDLLRIESISTDPAFAGSCARAAEWLVRELARLGFEVSARPTPGHPIVVGHHHGEGPHVLFYAHYDVQPVDPLDLWTVPPFEPTLVNGPDGRKWISARGAADDKGQLMTFVEAVRAWKEVAGRLPLRVTVCLEGEEESGSANLKPFLVANAGELKADVALVCDTDMWSRERPAITISLRGLAACEVIVTAANRDLHSGMYGGAARNPIHVLADILAALHDADGRVALPGFYDRVGEVPEAIRRQWDGLGFDPREFLGEVGLSIPAGEGGRTVLEQIWSRPTAEVNGITGGYTGRGFKTVIPSEARAKVSFRLVGDQDPKTVVASFAEFARARVPADSKVDVVALNDAPATRLPADGFWLARARRALADEWGIDPAMIGSGGSIPVAGYSGMPSASIH